MITKLRADYMLNTETFEVQCDHCDCCEEYEVEGGWEELVQTIKENGWDSRFIEKEWQHVCSNCRDVKK